MRYYGKIGFVKQELSTDEEHPGVVIESIIEKPYYGDVLKNSRKWESGESINDTLTISNQLSILADSFAYSNIGAMKYAILYNQKWTISSVDIERPRITLTLGGIYNA